MGISILSRYFTVDYVTQFKKIPANYKIINQSPDAAIFLFTKFEAGQRSTKEVELTRKGSHYFNIYRYCFL
jgi:hypothetical protein